MATATVLLPLLGASLDETNPPGVTWTNQRPKLLFDAATDEIAYWTFRLPADYSSALTLKFQYSMASATSGNVIIACQVMAVTDADAQDMDTDSYDTVNTSAATAVPGTAGYLDEISLTLTNADSAAAGDYVAVKVSRDANNASDTATGDLELWAASIEYTTA